MRKGAGLTALFHQSTQCHTVVRRKALRKEEELRDLFHQSTQCHTVVRWKALEKRRGLERYSTSQRSVTRWSDVKPVRKGAGLRALFHQSTQCHTVVRLKALRKVAGLTAQRGTFVSHPEQLSSVLRGPGAVPPFGPSLSEPEPRLFSALTVRRKGAATHRT